MDRGESLPSHVTAYQDGVLYVPTVLETYKPYVDATADESLSVAMARAGALESK